MAGLAWRLRDGVCAHLCIPSHRLEPAALAAFVREHFRYIQLGQEFPAARRYSHTVSPHVLDLFRGTFAGMQLGWSAVSCTLAQEVASRCRAVAGQGHLVWPRASARAACVMSYASLKCEELYRGELCWHASILEPLQWGAVMEPPRIDFFFWLAYGSWSHCPCCGVYHFQDEYLRHQVLRASRTTKVPALMASHVRRAPSLPVEHGLQWITHVIINTHVRMDLYV